MTLGFESTSILTPQAPGPAPSDADLATALRVTIGRLSRRLRPTAAAVTAGLTPTRVTVLLEIVRRGPVRVSDVASGEGLNPTMLSRVISHLVDDGLVERSSDEHDRRAAWVAPTAAGRRLAQRIRRERTRAVDAALAELGEAQRRAVALALPALQELAEQLRGAVS